MPLINSNSLDEKFGGLGAYEHKREVGFGEVFDASLGQVFDEGLSISSMLNREGFTSRKATVDQMIRDGEIENAERYRTKGGRNRALDYNRIASDLGRDDIKTDVVLNEERNETLRARREYSQETIARGSGVAQFLGAMNGYVLDPINIVTMGVSTVATTAKGVGTLGKIALSSRKTALVSAATELGIQPFVFEHKQDIGSPYSAADSLAAIGFAAAGGAAIGGFAGGVSAWLGKVANQADDLPQTPEVIAARDYIRRQQNTLRGSPRVVEFEGLESGKLRAADDIVMAEKAELTAMAGQRLDRGTVKTLTAERRDFEFKLKAIKEPTADDIKLIIDRRKKANPKEPARARKRAAEDEAQIEYETSRADMLERIDSIDQNLQASKVASRAEADLSRLEQGIIHSDLKARIDRAQARVIEAQPVNRVATGGDDVIEGSTSTTQAMDNPASSPNGVRSEVDPTTLNGQQIAKDIEYLAEMEARDIEYSRPTKTAAMYETPPPSKKPQANATQREREIMQARGIDDTYNQEVAKYNTLENKMLIVDGEAVDADALIKQLDDEMEGLNSVLTCAYKI